MTSISGSADSGDGFWEGAAQFLLEALKEHGVVAVVLVVMLVLFWQLIWKVWSATLKSKDEEIERLVTERDKYQKLVFDRLLSSRVDLDEPSDSEPGEGAK